MICESPCYEFVVDCCKSAIKLKAGLTANTQYLWCVLDKIQDQTYENTATTDADGLLSMDAALLPDALFNCAAGTFELRIKTADLTHTPVLLTFGTTQYACVLLSFKEFEGDADLHDTIQ